MNSYFYLLDDCGNIRFTREGLDHLSPLFELAGIDIKNVRTMQDYQQARKQASPYFLQHLSDRVLTWPDTDQFRLLKTAILGNEKDLQREVHRFEMKKCLKVIK